MSGSVQIKGHCADCPVVTEEQINGPPFKAARRDLRLNTDPEGFCETRGRCDGSSNAASMLAEENLHRLLDQFEGGEWSAYARNSSVSRTQLAGSPSSELEIVVWMSEPSPSATASAKGSFEALSGAGD